MRSWESRKACEILLRVLGGEDTQSVWVEEVEWMEDTQRLEEHVYWGERKWNGDAVFKGNSNKCTADRQG